jgi:hypothetical protein
MKMGGIMLKARALVALAAAVALSVACAGLGGIRGATPPAG